MDKSFENVCELDLIFHPDKCLYILDEIIQGGMVLETDKDEILQELQQQKKELQNKKEPTVTQIGMDRLKSTTRLF